MSVIAAAAAVAAGAALHEACFSAEAIQRESLGTLGDAVSHHLPRRQGSLGTAAAAAAATIGRRRTLHGAFHTAEVQVILREIVWEA